MPSPEVIPMLRTHGTLLAFILCFVYVGRPVLAADAPQTIAQKIAGMERKDGFFPVDWDARAGKLYLEIPRTDDDFLLLDQLPYGLGSNDVGLDRGQLGEGRIVHFSRVGGKVLLIQPNLMYRSSASAAEERLAVKQSFAESVLWGFPIEAEENGRILVDATSFFLRDAHGVAERLQATGQGAYNIDAGRSALAMENTRTFPKNTEVEAMLTFVTDGEPKGQFVASVTPDPHAVTLRDHTSMVPQRNSSSNLVCGLACTSPASTWWRWSGAWRRFRGDRAFLPALHLLTGIGLILMVSLRDPLRDTLEFHKFALGVFLGCLLLVLPALKAFDYRRLSDWCYTPLFARAGPVRPAAGVRHGPGGQRCQGEPRPVPAGGS